MSICSTPCALRASLDTDDGGKRLVFDLDQLGCVVGSIEALRHEQCTASPA